MNKKEYLDEKEKTLLPWERRCTLDGFGDGIYTTQTICSEIAGGLYRQMIDKMKECKISLTYQYIDAVTDEFRRQIKNNLEIVDRCVDEQRDREVFG